MPNTKENSISRIYLRIIVRNQFLPGPCTCKFLGPWLAPCVQWRVSIHRVVKVSKKKKKNHSFRDKILDFAKPIRAKRKCAQLKPRSRNLPVSQAWDKIDCSLNMRVTAFTAVASEKLTASIFLTRKLREYRMRRNRLFSFLFLFLFFWNKVNC